MSIDLGKMGFYSFERNGIRWGFRKTRLPNPGETAIAAVKGDSYAIATCYETYGEGAEFEFLKSLAEAKFFKKLGVKAGYMSRELKVKQLTAQSQQNKSQREQWERSCVVNPKEGMVFNLPQFGDVAYARTELSEVKTPIRVVLVDGEEKRIGAIEWLRNAKLVKA